MLKLDNITLSRGEKRVISGLSLSLPDEGVMAVLGPSGCGKTTLLRLFMGLLAPDSGSFTGMEGKKISIVFQEDRLLPWLTAKGNVSSVGESAAACLEAVELLDAADKKPAELSGGMQRRVAIARALAFGGDVLVLDEPFKGLDDALAARVAKKLAAAFPLIIIATHDINEARLMGEPVEIRLS